MFVDCITGRATDDGSFVQNSGGALSGGGPMGEVFESVRFDPGLLRPFIETDPNSPMRGRPCVTYNTGRFRPHPRTGHPIPIFKKALIRDLQERGINSPVFNTTFIPREVWVRLDAAIVKSTRKRLKAWDVLSRKSSVGGFDGMSTLTYEYDVMSDPGEAVVDMDGLADGRTDAPLAQTSSIPLPITHSDFWASQRRIAVTRNGRMPYDTTMGEAAGRRVSETIEKTTIGVETGMTYGTRSTGPDPHRAASTVWGMTNYPYRVLKTDLTTPDGTNPEAINQDVMEMIETMEANGFYGPYILFHSTPYSIWLNSDYFRTGSTSAVRSVRMRIMENEGIEEIIRLDYLTSGYQLILAQLDSETAQAINGLETTVVQWPSQGGMRQNFKVMCIKAPLFKAPYNGVAALVHGTTS